jgi:hypothetical protein
VLPASYCDLPKFRATLGRCLTDLGRFDEAESQLLATYERELAMRGARHRNTREVVTNLIRLYEAWGRPDEAAQWRNK